MNVGHDRAVRQARGPMQFPRGRALVAAVLLISAIVMGGGGSPSPLAEFLLQCVAVGCFIAWLFLPRENCQSPPVAIVVLAALVLVLPLVQLVPLPPSIWHDLPGREMAVGTLRLVGSEDRWMPLSLVPHATFASLLSLGPPLLLLVMTASLPVKERHTLLLVLAVLGLVTVVLGAAQLAGGGYAFRLYSRSHIGWITGFQANRNATVDVLLIALLALAATGRNLAIDPTRRLILWGLAALLALGAVLTGSRTGIALLVPVLVLCLVAAKPLSGIGKRAVVGLGAIAVGAILAGWLAFSRLPVLEAVAARFDAQSDARVHLWADSWQALQAYWPVGGGIGGFVSMMLPFESLEVVDKSMPNRAHIDYLEWAIEAGAPGLIVLALATALVVFMAVRAWRSGKVPMEQGIFALGTMSVIAAHSIVDYPLRSMSLACILALAVGMLAISRDDAVDGKGLGT